MYVCMYGWPSGRRGSRGEERRKRYDTIAAEDLRPVAQVRISVTREPNRSIVSRKFIRSLVIYSLDPFSGMMGMVKVSEDSSLSSFGFGFFFL